MSILLEDGDCENIHNYVSWLEDRLEEEAGCYSDIVKKEITEKFKECESSFLKIAKGI